MVKNLMMFRLFLQLKMSKKMHKIIFLILQVRMKSLVKTKVITSLIKKVLQLQVVAATTRFMQQAAKLIKLISMQVTAIILLSLVKVARQILQPVAVKIRLKSAVKAAQSILEQKLILGESGEVEESQNTLGAGNTIQADAGSDTISNVFEFSSFKNETIVSGVSTTTKTVNTANGKTTYTEVVTNGTNDGDYSSTTTVVDGETAIKTTKYYALNKSEESSDENTYQTTLSTSVETLNLVYDRTFVFDEDDGTDYITDYHEGETIGLIDTLTSAAADGTNNIKLTAGNTVINLTGAADKDVKVVNKITSSTDSTDSEKYTYKLRKDGTLVYNVIDPTSSDETEAAKKITGSSLKDSINNSIEEAVIDSKEDNDDYFSAF